MDDTMTLRVTRRGLVTLPKVLRDGYSLQPGTRLTLLDLGGVFVLHPHRSDIDTLADGVSDALQQAGESLATMLQALRTERERYDEADRVGA